MSEEIQSLETEYTMTHRKQKPHNLCVQDNEIIFEITSQEKIKIPKMSLINLKDILFKKLKLGKACDIFHLSVEHLRYSGDETLTQVLRLLNLIIDNI